MEVCYDIANEGFSINSLKNLIKNAISKAINIFKMIIRTIKSVINKLLNKTFKVNVFAVDYIIYDQVMSLIRKVEDIDTSYIDKIKTVIDVLKDNTSDIMAINNDIITKIKDLNEIKKYVSNIKPNINSKKVVIRQKYYDYMANRFEIMKDNCSDEIVLNNTLYNLLLKAIQPLYSVNKDVAMTINNKMNLILNIILKNSYINSLKASLLIELAAIIQKNKVAVTNGKVEKGIDKNMIVEDNIFDTSDAIDVEFREVNRSNNSFISLNSFIDFCDEYQIANESLRKAKKEYKISINDINKSINDIYKMPDSTIEQKKAKIEVINHERDNINDLIIRMKSEKPDVIDNVLSTLSKICSGALTAGAVISSLKSFTETLHGNYESINYISRILYLVGYSPINDLIKSGEINNRKSAVRLLIKNLSNREKELLELEKSLSYMI